MKIMIVIPTLGTGGAERVATTLANSFSKLHNVEFFVMENSSVDRYPLESRVSVVETGINVKRGNKFKTRCNYVINFLKQKQQLLTRIKVFKPDVVLSFLPKADFLVFSVLRRKSEFRWISSERNDPWSRTFTERFLLNFIYKKTDYFVCQTKKVAQYYKKKRVSNTVVIKNPIHRCDNERTDFQIKYKYLLAVGRLDKQKNYELLIKAFSQVKKQCECEEKLVILGDGPERERLQRLIDKNAMGTEIFLLGRKTNVDDYLKNASFFVMSSNYEGLPNALIEAMVAGLPVISTNFSTGAASELIDERNGCLVSVGNIGEMIFAIKKLLAISEEERIKMGIVSKERTKSMDIDLIIKMWNSIVNRGGKDNGSFNS